MSSAVEETTVALIERLVQDGTCQWRLSIHWDDELGAFSVRLLDEDGQTYRGTVSRSLDRAVATVYERVRT